MTNHIVKVTVRGYSGRGAGSRFIRWFTFGEYSHVSIVFWFRDGTAEEWEALQGHELEPHTPRDDYDIEYVAPLSYEQAIDAHLICCQLEGAKYDWKGIFGFLKRKDNQDPEMWFCSELVAYALWKTGYPLSRREPFRESPTSVMESLRLVKA